MYEIKKDAFQNINDEYDYFISAQRDIMTISNTIESKRFSLEDNVETICRCSAEAAEKMLRGWIIYNDNNADIYGNHDLTSLNMIANKYDISFSGIEDSLIYLNNYTTELRYSSRFTIEKHEVKECLKYLKSIYDFPLIKELREKLNIEKDFVKLPDNINLLFGEYGAI